MPIIWSVPSRHNLYYTGHEPLFPALHQALSQTPIQALSGLGGMGKSEGATQYCVRFSQQYQAIMWLNASSEEAMSADARVLAAMLSLHGAKPLTELQRWLQRHEQWLLVLDDLETGRIVEPLVPQCLRGHVLITTRHLHSGFPTFPMPLLTQEESVLFLLRRSKLIDKHAFLDAASAEWIVQATVIAQQMEGYVLALDQAGAYQEEVQRGLAHYADLYQRHRKELLARRGGFGLYYPTSVTETIAQTCARLTPAALEWLRIMACCPHKAISIRQLMRVARAGHAALPAWLTDLQTLDQAVEQLLDLCLMQEEEQTGMLHLHRLVQMVLLDALTDEQYQTAQRQASVVLPTQSEEDEPLDEH